MSEKIRRRVCGACPLFGRCYQLDRPAWGQRRWIPGLHFFIALLTHFFEKSNEKFQWNKAGYAFSWGISEGGGCSFSREEEEEEEGSLSALETGFILKTTMKCVYKEICLLSESVTELIKVRGINKQNGKSCYGSQNPSSKRFSWYPLPLFGAHLNTSTHSPALEGKCCFNPSVSF